MTHLFLKNHLFIWLIAGYCCINTMQAAVKSPPSEEKPINYNFLSSGLPKKYKENCQKVFDENKPFLTNFYKYLMYLNGDNQTEAYTTLHNFFQLFTIAATEIPNGIFYVGSSYDAPLTDKSLNDTIQELKEKKVKINPPFGQIYVANKNDFYGGILKASRPDFVDFDKFKTFYNKFKTLKRAWEDNFKILIGAYKIHLMPNEKTDKDIEEVQKIWIKLLELIKKDAVLQEKITRIKIAPGNLSLIKDAGAPRIVIYVYGKNNAQNVLDSLYAAFKGIEGSNEGPLFNEKVTSLIYFSQGERIFKGDENADFYETNRIYYKNILEDGTSYKLVNPAKK